MIKVVCNRINRENEVNDVGTFGMGKVWLLTENRSIVVVTVVNV